MPRLLPNWLEAYLVYTYSSESPELFHLWTGISMIAGALQRHCWFDMGYYDLYPNLYVVLVSPPGRCKKSTAIRTGRRLAAGIDDYIFGVDSTSREKIVQNMAKSFKNNQSPLTIHSSEFASLFATSKENMLIFATDIYECPPEWTHDTVGNKEQKIKAPFLNILAGTTPESLVRDVPVEAIGVGLMSRVIFVHEDTPRHRHWRPTLTPEQLKLREMLMNDLKHIHEVIKGPYQITEDFDALFEKWNATRATNFNPTHDARLDSYFDRKPDHLKKVCMIVAASLHDEMILTADDLALTMNLMEQVEARMPLAFLSIGRNPLTQDISNVLGDILSQPGGVSEGELMNRFRHNVRLDELREILTTLLVGGHVVIRDGRYFNAGIAAPSALPAQSDSRSEPE